MNLPDEAEALFELAPENFTAERDRIAGDLKKQGDIEPAALVKALKRPSVTAYALNLVARRHPALVDDLLEADEQFRNSRSRTEMDDAKAARQKAISVISSTAASILGDQDRTVTAQVRERLTETLLAVATDDRTRAALKAGRLLKEVEGGGFGGPVTAFDTLPTDDEDRMRRERIEKLRSEAEAKQVEANKARADSERADHESKELAEASAAAGERAGKLANIARKAGELAEAKLAEAEELEGSSG